MKIQSHCLNTQRLLYSVVAATEGNIVRQQYETTTRQQMNTTVDDLQDIARMCIFYLMFMLQYNTLCTVNPSNWKTANKRAWSKSFTQKEVAEALAVSDPNCSMEYYTCAQGHDLNDVLLGQDLTGEVRELFIPISTYIIIIHLLHLIICNH